LKIGVQIQYNVSRLEEWCTGTGIAEATLHLQQLLQAAKLLTLNKSSPQDIETIFDVCFLLNPSQIKKLLSLYFAADFDSPVRRIYYNWLVSLFLMIQPSIAFTRATQDCL
jgi:myosin V